MFCDVIKTGVVTKGGWKVALKGDKVGGHADCFTVRKKWAKYNITWWWDSEAWMLSSWMKAVLRLDMEEVTFYHILLPQIMFYIGTTCCKMDIWFPISFKFKLNQHSRSYALFWSSCSYSVLFECGTELFLVWPRNISYILYLSMWNPFAP